MTSDVRTDSTQRQGWGKVRWGSDVPAGISEAVQALTIPPGAGLVVQVNSGAIVGANEGASELLGLSWEAMMGRTSIDPRWAAVTELGNPLPGERHPAMLTLADGQPISDFLMGVLIPAPQGSRYAIGGRTRWIEVETVPLFAGGSDRTSDNLPDGVAAIFVDATKTDRARMATDTLLTTYRLLGEAAPGLVLRVDPAGLVVHAAPSECLEPRTIEGHHLDERLHPDDRAEFREFWQRLLAGTTEPQALECRWQCAQERFRWNILTANLIFDSAGQVCGAAVSVQDVHEVRQTRAKLDEMRETLELQEFLANLAIDGSNLATWQWDRTTGATTVNERWAGIIGYSLSELEPVDQSTWEKTAHPDDVAKVTTLLRRVVAGEQTRFETESRRRHRNGSWVWVRDFGGVTERDEHGTPTRLSGIQEDISVRMRAQQAVSASERHYRLLAENMSDAVWVLDGDGAVQWVSDSTHRLLGWRGEALLGRKFDTLVHPADRASAADLFVPEARMGACECRMLSADGGHLACAVSATSRGSSDEVVLALHDIESEITARSALQRAVKRDSVTGLANRGQVVAALNAALRRLADSWHLGGQRCVAALVLGIDGLTAVNEAFTHAAGDQILREVGRRLEAQVGPNRYLGRGSGDEFLVIVEDATAESELAEIADQLRLAVKGGVDLQVEEVFPSVSVGIAHSLVGTEPEELLRDAATAMRMAKSRGRDQVDFFSIDEADLARLRLRLDADIRHGLTHGEFVAWYQPIVDLRTDATVGYEALVRWEQANGEVVPPDSFLPVAEESELISEIDREVLSQAVAILATLPKPMTMAVNVSARTLGDARYFAAVEQALARHQVAPERLHLEVTETSLPRITEVTTAEVVRLAQLGVKWYADDFGTGYSSIAILRDLPIAGLKLDRTFTHRLGRGDATSGQLARAIAGLAEQLGIDAVAEGVETAEEASVLLGQGWQHAQGWLCGKPTKAPPAGA